MNRFGIDRVFYRCPHLDKGVLLSLNYKIYKDEKIITLIDCENRLECKTIEMYGWKKCPAYKKFVGEHH